jgi:heterodisulfide reductase subunit D
MGWHPMTDIPQMESLICAQCGACRDVCPSFRHLGWESSSPRGRMTVLKGLTNAKRGMFAATDEEIETLCQCTLCGACGQICAALIDTREVWLETRSSLVRAHKAVGQFSKLAEVLQQAKNIAAFDNESRLEWAEDLDEKDAPVGIDEAGRESGVPVDLLYFVGCVASFYPRAAQIAQSLSEVLGAAGVRFAALGGEEWCCGFPLMASGHADEARLFREHNVQQIVASGVKELVTACPSCFHVYSGLCGEQLLESGVTVLHASQLLLRLIREGSLNLTAQQTVVTYHDPCDLGRNSGVYEEPREILSLIPGVSLVELTRSGESAACCGGGGNLQSFDQRLVEGIADARVEEVVESGAEVVVSACPQCEQVLEAAIRRRALSIRVVDICEFVLSSLG